MNKESLIHESLDEAKIISIISHFKYNCKCGQQYIHKVLIYTNCYFYLI